MNRIILRNVRSIEHLDVTLRNDWTQKPLDSVLVVGPNGSGKTTLLRVIAGLWEKFYLKPPKFEEPQSDKFWDFEFTAIQIQELMGQTVWLYWGGKFDVQDVKQTDIVVQVARTWSTAYVEQGPQDWLEAFTYQRRKAEVGAPDALTLPNLIYLGVENREVIQPISGDEPSSYFEPSYRWLVTYNATNQPNVALETMLRNAKLRSESEFYKLLHQINTFYENKNIFDFDSHLRLVVTLSDGRTHYIEDLSAGERQCLIQMFMVSRWLREGGVVLIDEPDLHLHVGLQRHFIHEMEKLVTGRGGQLIVASHSPALWEEYDLRQRISLGQPNPIEG
ncbi:MAG: AAA family ATPase [bacterium]|nr:AAA family ATPase [bacterium]